MPVSAARALAPDALFELSYVHDACMAADGRHVAYVVSRTDAAADREYFQVVIQDLTAGAERVVDFEGQASAPKWSPDGARLAFVGTRGDSSRLYVWDCNSQRIEVLSPQGMQVHGPASWSPEGQSLVYAAIDHRRPQGVHRVSKRIFRAEGLGVIDSVASTLHRVSVASAASQSLDAKCSVAMRPAFSPCGTRVLFLGAEVAEGYPSLSLQLFVLDLDGGAVRRVLGEGWYIATAAWSPCGQRIIFAGDYASALWYPKVGLWAVGLDGSDPEPRTRSLSGNVGVMAHHDMSTWGSSQGNTFVVCDASYAYATVTQAGGAALYRIALTGTECCAQVVGGERTCVILDASSNAKKLLFSVSDLHRPWELHWANLDGGGEEVLTRLNEPVLASWPALRTEHLRFKSADGLPLEGWFVSRADRHGPQPTVLFIHGGPELCVGHCFRFDWWLLAANGFAVVFANFRGSSGYGEAFMSGLQGQWGEKGMPDHMATLDAAVAQGHSDANRVGVWGPSHGGFAAAWLVCHSARFRAAVAESAVSNFATLYYLSDIPEIIAKDLGGRPDEIPEVYRARSSLTYALRCQTPTLIVHGEADLRCPIGEAEQLYRALLDAGCVTELVRVPGMTHMGDSVGPLSARLAQNEALLEWFERHL